MHFSMTTILAAALAFHATALPTPDPNANTLEVSSAPSIILAKRYAGGWCGMHIVQYQKNEGPYGPSGRRFKRCLIPFLSIIPDPEPLSLPGASAYGLRQEEC